MENTDRLFTRKELQILVPAVLRSIRDLLTEYPRLVLPDFGRFSKNFKASRILYLGESLPPSRTRDRFIPQFGFSAAFIQQVNEPLYTVVDEEDEENDFNI